MVGMAVMVVVMQMSRRRMIMVMIMGIIHGSMVMLMRVVHGSSVIVEDGSDYIRAVTTIRAKHAQNFLRSARNLRYWIRIYFLT